MRGNPNPKNQFQKGHSVPQEWRDILSKKNKGHKPPKTAFKKGHHSKSEWKKGQRAKNWNGYKRGKDNPNYTNGKYSGEYSEGWKETLRESIRQRDNYICWLCGIHQDELSGFSRKLDVHHIDYDKQNCNPDNLISLCRECHLKTNHNRDVWKTIF